MGTRSYRGRAFVTTNYCSLVYGIGIFYYITDLFDSSNFTLIIHTGREMKLSHWSTQWMIFPVSRRNDTIFNKLMKNSVNTDAKNKAPHLYTSLSIADVTKMFSNYRMENRARSGQKSKTRFFTKRRRNKQVILRITFREGRIPLSIVSRSTARICEGNCNGSTMYFVFRDTRWHKRIARDNVSGGFIILGPRSSAQGPTRAFCDAESLRYQTNCLVFGDVCNLIIFLSNKWHLNNLSIWKLCATID